MAAPKRWPASAESKARAERIAAALAGLLEPEPAKAAEDAADPYRPRPPGANPPPIVQLSCPGCGAAMVSQYDRGVEIDRCVACAGVWLEPGELDAIVATIDGAPSVDLRTLRIQMQAVIPVQPKIRYRKCPCCRGVMSRKNFGAVSGVILDECPQHGVFVEEAELVAIARFVELGGMTLVAAEASQRRAVELRQRNQVGDRVPYTRQGAGQRWWARLLGFLFG